MQIFLIVCGIGGALVGGYLLLLAFGVWKEMKRSRKTDAILERLASLWIEHRSSSDSIADAEAMIYRNFAIPIHAPDPVAFFRDLRKSGDRSDPLMFEWMVLRETAYNILCYMGIYPRPRGQGGAMTMGDDMNQSSAIIGLCTHLRRVISRVEQSGTTPPAVLTELAVKGLDITTYVMTGKPELKRSASSDASAKL